MIDQGDRTASIEAESDLKCYGLTFWDFRPLVESDARIAWPLLQAMAKRLRAAESRVGLLAPRRSSRARAGSPLRASASTPSSTRPPKSTQRTPSSRARRARPRPAPCPRSVVAVDRALAGDDEVGPRGPLAEADRLEHVGRARDELGAERGERRAEPARRAAARELARAAARRPRTRRSSSATSSASAPFCGPKSARRLDERGARVAERRVVGAGSSSEHLEQAGAAVHRGRAAEADEQPLARPGARRSARRARGSRRAAARRSRDGSSGIASALSTTTVPSASARTGASRGRPNASWTRSTRTHRRAPSTTARSLAAVRERQLLGLGAGAPRSLGPARPRPRRR